MVGSYGDSTGANSPTSTMNASTAPATMEARLRRKRAQISSPWLAVK